MDFLFFQVLWNGRSHLEVSVPGTYKKHMCGLCGNFNNYPQDDMRLRNGQIATSEAAFGNDWKVKLHGELYLIFNYVVNMQYAFKLFLTN